MGDKQLIIGVSGKLGSGKDFFAEEFAKLRIRKRGFTDVERHAFADNVRETTQLITGYPLTRTHEKNEPFVNEVYNYTQEDKNVFLDKFGYTIGESLQLIGTDAIRNGYNFDTWVISLFETKAKTCLLNGNILIIPDVRFPNEADYIRSMGGHVFRMVGDPMDIRKNTTRDINHISETALDDYKFFSELIKNDVPDKEALIEKIKLIQKKYI